jgi:SAM-dependent methyltransferase
MATRVANTAMAAAWDGADGDHWTTYADHYERASLRHWQRLVEAVPIAATASAIDVGCGTGRSTRDLARIVTAGSVVGIDLSSRMLEHGRAAAAAEGLDNITFEQGDAEVYPFAPAAADLATSVFGAMFFGDPDAAFRNIRKGFRPGGTLALLTWRELADNEWLYAVRDALALGRELPEPAIGAPGPLGLADADEVRRILTESGYADVALAAVDEPMEFGRDADDAFAYVTSTGITRGLVHDLDDDQKEQALANLRQLLDEHATADGVLLGSSAWLVTAGVP